MKHGAAWLVWVTLAIAIVVACVPSLPSSEPLGEGPLAEPEPSPDQTSSRPKDAGPDADAKSPKNSPKLADASTDAAKDGDARDGDADSADTSADAPDAEPPDSATVDWAGLYVGEDVTKIRVDGFPDQEEKDSKAKTKVEVQGSDAIRITIVNSRNGDPICALDAKVSGDEASVKAGQTCFSEGGMIQGTVSGGRAKIQGDRLVLDLDVDLELSLGPETRQGNIEYHFEGDRQ